MYQIIHSAKVVKCDETAEVGILVDGKVLPIGSAPSWNDLTGKPFDETRVSTLCFEVSDPTPEYDDWNGRYLLSYKTDSFVDIVSGETYHVVTDTFEGDLVGNASGLHTPDQSLFIKSRSNVSDYYIECIGSVPFPTYIKVEKIETAVKQLDIKYLPIEELKAALGI